MLTVQIKFEIVLITITYMVVCDNDNAIENCDHINMFVNNIPRKKTPCKLHIKVCSSSVGGRIKIMENITKN